MLHESTGGSWNLLDDAKALLAARRDAAGFVRESERPLFVDKVQRAGNPFILAVKAAVDLVDTPGQFYLAGRIQFAGFESLLVPKSISAQNESRHATMERVCRGEMPQAIRLAGRDRREFLGSYARTAEIEPNDSTNGSSLSRSQPFGRCDPDG